MLYIRVDGNTDIGMGHIMRCLSIAEAAKDLGCPSIFITAEESCSILIAKRGFQVKTLYTDYRDMLSELSLLADMFDRESDMLLVDSYQVSSKYFLALRKLVWVACLEDMGQAYPVNLLINYNIYAPKLKEKYQMLDCNKQVLNSKELPERVLLGLEYMPLRKEFQKPALYNIKDKVTDVIITTGGSDPCFAAATLADVFIENPFLSKQDIKLHIISGPFNRFSEELNRKYGDCNSIVIHENVKDMKGLFLQSDVVISAAGSTIYEISTLGVPMIIFYFAENQRQGAETFASLTDILNAGCFANEGRIVADRVMEALERCIRDKSYRERLYRQEKKLMDGKGAYRLAKQLIDTRTVR